MDPAIPALIEHLCSVESQHRDGTRSANVELPQQALNQVLRIYRQRLREMFLWLGIGRDEMESMLRELNGCEEVAVVEQPSEGAEARAEECVAEPVASVPMVWDAWRQAGALLTARLALASSPIQAGSPSESALS
jgi:hypothetical protein